MPMIAILGLYFEKSPANADLHRDWHYRGVCSYVGSLYECAAYRDFYGYSGSSSCGSSVYWEYREEVRRTSKEGN